MPKLAPKKMNEDHNLNSPSKNSIKYNHSASKRNNQTQGIDLGLDDTINATSTAIHNTKQSHTI